MIRISTAARSAVAIGAVGVAVMGFAPTASAAGGDSLTVAGAGSATYTTNQSPGIQAVAEPTCAAGSPGKVTLTIDGPGVIPQLATLKSGTPIDCNTALDLAPDPSTVNTASPKWSGGVPAMNGKYTLSLNNAGTVTAKATFTLLVAPAKTTGFSASPQGTSAKFSWSANHEPDIIGYVIKNGAGKTVAQPTDACSGTACSDGPVNLGSRVAGHTAKFSIVAVRSCGGAACSGGILYGRSPATTSAKFATASTRSPSPTPTSGGKSGTGGSGGHHGGNSGTGSLTDGGTKVTHGKTGTLSDPGGTTATRHRRHHGLFAGLPSVGAGLLPHLSLPSLPSSITTSARSGEPQALGKPGGNLKYPAPQIATKKTVVATGGGFTHELRVAVNQKPLWRGIAAAAVLLLIAVHLRTWAGREEYL